MIPFVPSRNPYLSRWAVLHTWHCVALRNGDAAMAMVLHDMKYKVWLESVS